MRHGIGRAIATYVLEPSGLMAEFYCDMERIYDDGNHVPVQWDIESDHKWVSLWAPHLPREGWGEICLPPAARSNDGSNRRRARVRSRRSSETGCQPHQPQRGAWRSY
jgi:hypothetical protein